MVKESYNLLKERSEELGINFIGNVEGRDAFSGKIDAIITDGFTGNVFLKTTEGLGKFVKKSLKESLFKNVLSKGKYFSGKNIEAFIKNNNKKFNYLGLAISVKTAKAVKRNKIKRLIRENYKLLENDIESGKSIVFLWKKNVNVENATFENVKSDMNYIFDKANIKNMEI